MLKAGSPASVAMLGATRKYKGWGLGGRSRSLGAEGHALSLSLLPGFHKVSNCVLPRVHHGILPHLNQETMGPAGCGLK